MVSLIKQQEEDNIRGARLCGVVHELRKRPDVLDVLMIWKDIVDQFGSKIDSNLAIIMPVFSHDTLDSLVQRYARTFPQEVALALKNLEIENSIHGNGWTEKRTMRLAAQIPETLYKTIKLWCPTFWHHDNASENIARFKQVCPRLVCGDV